MSSDNQLSKLPILPETRHFPTNPDTFSIPSAIPATPPAPQSRVLSERQLRAIPLVLQGLPDADIADEIGVTRQTISDWRNHHPLFIAHLNRQRERFHAEAYNRYHRLLDQAMDVLADQQVNSINLSSFERARVALGVLRTATRHTLRPNPTPPPTDPHEIELDLLTHDLPISPDDSPANDAPPPPPKKPRK